MSKKRSSSRTRSIYISDECWERLERAAEKRGIAVSAVVEWVVRGLSDKELQNLLKP